MESAFAYREKILFAMGSVLLSGSRRDREGKRVADFHVSLGALPFQVPASERGPILYKCDSELNPRRVPRLQPHESESIFEEGTSQRKLCKSAK